MTAVLEIRDVAKRFGATTALDGVDFTLRAGEVHALIGENGAGKSTLMNILAGAVRPDRGAMQVDGRPYAPGGPGDARRRGIALIHQELCLCPHLSAAENMLLGLEPARGGWVDRGAARRRALALLVHFGRPTLHPDDRVADLPLAAQQVVEICRALAADARILLMDEPTSSLQREDVDRLFALIRQLATRGIAIIYISHFLEEVREIAAHYTILRDGRSVDGGSIADTSNDQLIAHMVGRATLTPWPPLRSGEGERHEGNVILAVHDVAAPPVLKQASFELRRGEVLGIAGLIGSGRSELVRALFGLEPRAAGRIVLRGQQLAVRGARPARRLAQGFGYLSENRGREGLALHLSVADNLTATRFSACSPGWGWLDLDRQRAAAQQWIDALHVRAASPAQPVRALSGGNQQKLIIGREFELPPKLLLVSQPTRGVDIGAIEFIHRKIVALRDEGCAVLLVSAELEEVTALSDRLLVIHDGRIVGEVDPKVATNEEIGLMMTGGKPTLNDE